MDISIVVPCYNEQEALPFFYKAFVDLSSSFGGGKTIRINIYR